MTITSPAPHCKHIAFRPAQHDLGPARGLAQAPLRGLFVRARFLNLVREQKGMQKVPEAVVA